MLGVSAQKSSDIWTWYFYVTHTHSYGFWFMLHKKKTWLSLIFSIDLIRLVWCFHFSNGFYAKENKEQTFALKRFFFVPILCLGCLLNGLTHVLRKRMHKLIGYINKSNFNIQASLITRYKSWLQWRASSLSSFGACFIQATKRKQTNKQLQKN